MSLRAAEAELGQHCCRVLSVLARWPALPNTMDLLSMASLLHKRSRCSLRDGECNKFAVYLLWLRVGTVQEGNKTFLMCQLFIC